MAAEEHPEALYVFGNAPTALMELCDLIRKEKGIIFILYSVLNK